jgi:Rod binding domain-containing protein
MIIAASNSGLPASAGRPQVNSAGSQPETLAHKKLRKAAQDFEGILISQLSGESSTGFSSLTGDPPMAGSDTLNSLTIQSLSSALASRGGLGIGKMLMHQLEPSLNGGRQNSGGGKIKTFSGG